MKRRGRYWTEVIRYQRYVYRKKGKKKRKAAAHPVTPRLFCCCNTSGAPRTGAKNQRGLTRNSWDNTVSLHVSGRVFCSSKNKFIYRCTLTIFASRGSEELERREKSWESWWEKKTTMEVQASKKSWNMRDGFAWAVRTRAMSKRRMNNDDSRWCNVELAREMNTGMTSSARELLEPFRSYE